MHVSEIKKHQSLIYFQGIGHKYRVADGLEIASLHELDDLSLRAKAIHYSGGLYPSYLKQIASQLLIGLCIAGRCLIIPKKQFKSSRM